MSDVITADDGLSRCSWVGDDPQYRAYHDDEWGRALHGDRALFEKMTLEGFQAGLSWITILRKREAFREVFLGFDARAIAAFGDDDVERLMSDARIVRNRAKIDAAISNARQLLSMPDGALDDLFWSFVPPARPRPVSGAEIPTQTPESVALSRALRAHGFRFVGPTTMYALMQSAGIVDDHVAGCHRAIA